MLFPARRWVGREQSKAPCFGGGFLMKLNRIGGVEMRLLHSPTELGIMRANSADPCACCGHLLLSLSCIGSHRIWTDGAHRSIGQPTWLNVLSHGSDVNVVLFEGFRQTPVMPNKGRSFHEAPAKPGGEGMRIAALLFCTRQPIDRYICAWGRV